MKLSEIPGIGDLYNTDLAEIREKVGSETKKNKEMYEHLKAVGHYLCQIDKHIKKIQIICSEEQEGIL